MCEYLLSFFTTSNTKADDQDRFQVYMNHEPNGTPTRSILHYAQLLKEDRFQVYAPDYHTTFDIHAKRITDEIPLEKIKDVPVAMFAGIDDTLADVADAEWAKE